MPAIVTLNSPPNTKLSLRPYHPVKDCIGKNDITIYRIPPFFSPFSSRIFAHLQKKHTNLIFSEECRRKPLPVSHIFWERMEKILSLTYNGTPKKIVILCRQEDARLTHLIKALTPFARSVSMVTDLDSFFSSISEEALTEHGLTINRRELDGIQDVDLIFLVSGNFLLSKLNNGYLINLTNEKISAKIPVLSAVTNSAVSGFLARHPYLQINPSVLLSEEDEITALLWEYC